MAVSPLVELHLAQHAAADALLSHDGFALLVGMQLDQQIPMEKAFTGPYVLAGRLGDVSRLDPSEVAAYAPEQFVAVMAGPPAVHRFPAAMAGRLQSLAQAIVDDYDGDCVGLWASAPTGTELLRRLTALPGFGDQKARIFVALLGKQLAVRPRGWRQAAGSYGDAGSFRSIADVRDPATLLKVRAFKKEMKLAAKTSVAGR